MPEKSYIVVTPLRNGGPEPIAPGRPVTLDAAEGDALVLIGALSPAIETVAPTPSPAPPAPPTGISVTDAPAAGAGEGIQLPGAVGPVGAPLPPIAKPLAAMNRKELTVEAAKVDVAIAVGMTNAQVVAAIEAKRASGGQ